jgi:hypothetical protein
MKIKQYQKKVSASLTKISASKYYKREKYIRVMSHLKTDVAIWQ